MNDGRKTYTVVIDGVKQSTDAVESLNKQLTELEKRIDALKSKNVSVSASGGGGSSTQSLEEEERLLKQIEQLHQKVRDTEKEEYQELLNAKQELKEYQTIAKSIAAQENLKSGINDTSTMMGAKAQLRDLKAAMQTVDMNGDQFKQWAAEANELTQKLKEAEASYGTFSRNVGNYSNGVAEGISKYKVQIGDTVREFDSAKQAAKELSNELLNLPKGAEGAEDLRKAIQSIKSDIKDLGKSSNVMDNLLDTMQSFTAIASVGQGISALFGIDDSEIEKSIQKLVALQNVMQGIEQLAQQMNTGEGLMGWLGKGNDMIDSFVDKLMGASKAQKELNEATTAGATASKTLATAEKAQAAATTTTTVATKALSLALKSIGIGLIISAVATLITYWEDIYKWFTDTIPALKNLSDWFDKIRAAAVGVGTAIVNFMIKPSATLAKTIEALINRNFSEIPKIIGDGLNETFNVVENFQKGYHKEIERQQKVHNKKVKEEQVKANEEQLKDEEAKYGRSHRRTQEYYRKQMALIDQSTKEGKEKYREYQRALWADERAEREETQRKATQNAKKAAADAKQNAKELAEAEKQAQEKLSALRISLMRDGLKKELAELDAENEKELAAIRKNGANRETLEAKQMELYEKKRKEIITKSAEEIRKARQEAESGIRDAEIKQMELINDSLRKTKVEYSKFVDTFTLKKELNLLPLSDDELKEYLDKLDGVVARYKAIADMSYNKNTDITVPLKNAKEEFGELWDIIDKYGINTIERFVGKDEKNLLSASLVDTIQSLDAYYNEVGNSIITNLKNIKTRREKLLEDQTKEEKGELGKWYQDELQAVPDLDDPHYQEIIDHNQQVVEAYNKRLEEINKKYKYENSVIEKDHLLDVSAVYDKYYQEALSKYEDFQSEINRITSRQPITNNWGIVNMGQTRKQLKEALAATETAINGIKKQFVSLERDYQNGIVTPEVYVATKKNLQAVEESVRDSADEIKDKMKNIPSDFAQSLQQYVQAVGQAVNTLISAFGDLYNYNIEKEMDSLDEMNEKLQEKYDEQEAIEQRHRDNIESIEDELATSRGDRRQQLIDMLNAEMEARREAAAEQKRIENEMAENQRKQDELQKKQRKAEYKRNLAQILVNGAMAVSQAAVNTWPIPAVPLMSLAGALTTAQYLIAKKQKPYAKGGLLEGPSHKRGGIPVGNTGIEVEGKEYVIRKDSTTPNIDLLDYINKSRRKLTLSDFIDFYEGKRNAIKRNVSGRYANGGQLPTMPDIDLGDIMTDVAILRDNRPIYVAVTDINQKQEDVRRVQVLAGL